VISDGTIVVRNTEPLTAAIDDEIVMLSPDRGAYFGLNPVGSSIWQLIGAPRTVSSLCRALMQEYDVDGRTCHIEVTSFLDQLERAGLIEIRR
jgi:hypothetical protein